MERSELFKAAAEKAAEVLNLFPDMKVDMHAHEDRVTVWFNYHGETDINPIYLNKPELHAETVRDLPKNAAAFVVEVFNRELKAATDARDALAAKLEVMENNTKEDDSHEA